MNLANIHGAELREIRIHLKSGIQISVNRLIGRRPKRSGFRIIDERPPVLPHHSLLLTIDFKTTSIETRNAAPTAEPQVPVAILKNLQHPGRAQPVFSGIVPKHTVFQATYPAIERSDP